MEYPDTIVILGAGGGALETYWVLHDCAPQARPVFVDDVTETQRMEIDGRSYPVVKDWDFTPYRKQQNEFTQFVVSVGPPRAKQAFVERATAAGLRPAPTLISPNGVRRPGCKIGRGGVIHALNNVGPCVEIGDFVLMHFASGLGHHAMAGDYVTVAPQAGVGGYCNIGEGVQLGVGCSIREGVTIAPWVQVGMNACVVRDIDTPGITVVGIPARPLHPAQMGDSNRP